MAGKSCLQRYLLCMVPFLCLGMFSFIGGCVGAEKEYVASLETGSEKKIEYVKPLRTKRVFEHVMIDGQKYLVPPPWRGRKIVQKSPKISDLKQIPIIYTKDESKIFIHMSACEALIKMAEKAMEENVHLQVHSGFRSAWYQKKIFSRYMKKGRTWEDLVRFVAPPGYSEHMLGTVVDFYPSTWEFASTPAYAWLKENGQDFGFSESYPEKSDQGFPWESWHWKYSGDVPDENIYTQQKE